MATSSTTVSSGEVKPDKDPHSSDDEKTRINKNNPSGQSNETPNGKRFKKSKTSNSDETVVSKSDEPDTTEYGQEIPNTSASNYEHSPPTSNYNDDSREAMYDHDGGQQSSQGLTDSIAMEDEFANVDEEDDGTFEGVQLTDIVNTWTQPPNLSEMKNIREGGHSFMIKSFKYDPNNPNREPEPIHDRGTYVDEWDENHVRLPCSPFYVTKNGTHRWPIIQEALKDLRNLSEASNATMEDIKYTIEECAGRKYEMNCLERLLNEIYSADERAHFMSDVLSNICQLAMNVDKICSRPPPLLRVRSNRSVTMSQRQAASLLACAFFCLFPRRYNQKVGSEYENYQNPNFNTLFQGGRSGGSPWKLEKLKCTLHYFKRITEKMPNGVITFRRYALPDSCMPKWSESPKGLCQVHLSKNKTIEDMDGLLQVDFANQYIGGGVMRDGCVQEEIRFVICPEMLLSLLVCEVMLPNECVFLVGCERFASYLGYSTTFRFKENYEDKTPKDEWGRKLCHVVAMDAICFSQRLTQYSIKNMKRELVKAYTSFRIPAAYSDGVSGVATGNWGCGAFNGNKQLKAIIQLIAASEAGRPLVYITYRDPELVKSFWKVYEYLSNQHATVSDLCAYLQKYTRLYNQSSLFDYILKTSVSSLNSS